jgi:starch synthase
VEFAFTDALEHRLTGGSDLVLMPSLYEPCGLTQMRALRYGAPAVARNVGGIHDTVEDDVTGFLFDAFDERALDAAIDRALDRFAQRRSWPAMMRRGMARDFGWARSAAAYREVYDAAERLVAAAT